MYTCPVCGYDQLQYRPTNFTICPSCYTEFGYDDTTLSHQELQAEWLRNGARWEGINVMPPPPGWDALKQVERLNKRRLNTSTSTMTTSGVYIAGRVVPPEQARITGVRVTLFGNVADIARNVNPRSVPA